MHSRFTTLCHFIGTYFTMLCSITLVKEVKHELKTQDLRELKQSSKQLTCWLEQCKLEKTTICYLMSQERNRRQKTIETHSQTTIKLLPWLGNFSLLPGDVGGLLRSLHSSVHLLSDLTGSKRDQVLPLSTNQDVLFVLPFLFRAIRKCGTAVAMALVAEPFPFVLETIRSPTHTKPCPLVILPLPTVGFCCRGIHVIIRDRQLCVCITKTGKSKTFVSIQLKKPYYILLQVIFLL